MMPSVLMSAENGCASPFGVARAAESGCLRADDQLPLILCVHTGEDLHQRALARAIFSADGM